MPVSNRVAIYGFGRLGRSVYSTTLNSGSNIKNNDLDIQQLAKVIFEEKGPTLKDIYKRVKYKYYPETDYFNKLLK